MLSTLTRHRDEDRAVETLLDFRCEAVLLLGPDMADDRLGALTAQVPVVTIGRRVYDIRIDVDRLAANLGVAEEVTT